MMMYHAFPIPYRRQPGRKGNKRLMLPDSPTAPPHLADDEKAVWDDIVRSSDFEPSTANLATLTVCMEALAVVAHTGAEMRSYKKRRQTPPRVLREVSARAAKAYVTGLRDVLGVRRLYR